MSSVVRGRGLLFGGFFVRFGVGVAVLVALVLLFPAVTRLEGMVGD